MELTTEEEAALNGKYGKTLEMAFRILVATGEATGAEKLTPIKWAHLSGVNYNTIGDAGEEFLAELSKDAKVSVNTTLNPMGYDSDNVSDYGIDDEFVEKQESIKESYGKMGVNLSFSCIPYEIFSLPEKGTRVSFAESNAAIYANSIAHLKTNKESAFSALASAITGKSPYSPTAEMEPKFNIRFKIDDPDELSYGLLGYFAGKVADNSVQLSGVPHMERRQCKSLCGGMGTSGTCSRFLLSDTESDSEKVDFDKKEYQNIYDELNTADKGDIITLGSPQLGLEEISSLISMVEGKRFKKRCMVFCPRAVTEQIKRMGYHSKLKRAGCEVLSDCCTCLTPLVSKENTDSVTTNSIKGAYYLRNSNGVGVNLKPLSDIIREETK
ncbi:MAG: DUF521 domain-containing protein [Nitrosopumilaceae archaeon]|nr:DUF521 domain-containing protein [Nitrosopumilaceae archaeon]NIU01909.1 DUF521 domain-containing protein [Nitrosopumilaceae archaeon]NIU88313.1 DUF521 domain-containing protein [Nitrosopumilaceae archaeon]NIV66605.1 DUF521 domain-containing protein [Nitrosopumilaceae archaeon]NIX62510.1 DUF521 domain-containing protein [Nitrosopumilaceae archaeon]